MHLLGWLIIHTLTLKFVFCAYMMDSDAEYDGNLVKTERKLL